MTGKKKDRAKKLVLKLKENHRGAMNLPLLENLQKVSVIARYDACAERFKDFPVKAFPVFPKLNLDDSDVRMLNGYFKIVTDEKPFLVVTNGSTEYVFEPAYRLEERALDDLDALVRMLNEYKGADNKKAFLFGTKEMKEYVCERAALLAERKEVATQLVALLGEMYKDEGNPIYVWWAIDLCNKAKLHPSVPGWCLDHIRANAAGIMRFMEEDRAPQAGEITKTFGIISAGRNAFMTARTSIRHHTISSFVKVYGALGLGERQAMDLAAETFQIELRSLSRIVAKDRKRSDGSKRR